MTPYIQQQLKKLCDNPNWYGDMKPAFYFEIPRDINRYLILGILDEAGYSHCCLLVQPKQMFNPQLN